MRIKGVIGQSRAVAQLEAEASANRLAHAYMFVGPAGVGRGTCALALFAALNCERPLHGAACGQCGSCRRAAAAEHEDLIILEPPSQAASSQIKVEAVREAIRATGFAPYGGGKRLILIRRAENLNPASGNALLKTLEEPPPNNILVLTVGDAKELLPTLVSRCRKVAFKPLGSELIAEELVRRGADPETARLKAGLSSGSLGRALALDADLLRQGLSAWLEQLAGGGQALEDWAFAEELVGAHRRAGGLDRQGISQGLDLLALFYRDQAVRAAGKGELALLPGGAAGPGLAGACAGFSRVRRAQGEILANAAPELALVVMMQKLRQDASGDMQANG